MERMNGGIKMKPRIGVVGLGGVGGYLAGMLTRTEAEVTVVARGERFEAISQRGIVLHSDFSGESITHPAKVVKDARELTEQDFLFICVKNYSLEDLLPSLQGAVGEHTIILPVMNGIDPGDRVRRGVALGDVVKCVIYIVSFAEADYSITQQGNFARVVFGMNPPKEEVLSKVDELFTRAQIQHKKADNIEKEVWKKFMLNCCYNVATAYYDCTIGPIRADKKRAENYEALAREAFRVGRAQGIPLEDKNLEDVIRKFREEYAEEAGSSLQRDMHAGKMAELDTFSGYIVREAKKLGIEVPVMEEMYKELKKRQSVRL